MNKENKESFFYQKNLNINNIKNLRLYINNPLNKIKPKKFLNNTVIRKKYTLISPSSFSNNPNRKNHIIIKPESQNNNINDKKIFNYVNTDSEDNFSFEHPKVYIKLNSLKKNIDISNTLSYEKNNKSNKYTISRIKPKNLRSNEGVIYSPYKTNNINQKINYSNINSLQNSFDYSDNNFSFCQKKNQEYSNINNNCNMTQEKNLTSFNDSIDNIVKEKSIFSYINTRNNIYQNKNKINNNLVNNKINKTNFVYNNNNKELNGMKKIIYKKKIRKKNNYSEIFSHYKILNINKQNDKKNLISPYRNNDLNNNLSTNTINQNKIYELIYNANETPQKLELLPKNNKEYKYINSYYNKNTSIILPSYTLTDPIVTNLHNNKKDKEYIKIENYNNNSLEINNNNKENNTKIFGLLISENKRNIFRKKEKNFSKKYNSTIRRKKILDFSSTKSSTDMLINVNKYSTNYFYGKNILNNNYIIENSNSFSNYNTVNSLNNTENNINYFNNDKLYPCRTLTEKYFVPDNKNKMFYLRNELLNNKINRLGKKNLKNVITSIEYKNDETDNEFDKKKVILSEFDKNGKLNIKFKKMNKSIEKIIKENSNPKIKKVYYLKPSKLTYIKKKSRNSYKKSKKI